jgi:hypothetical protein
MNWFYGELEIIELIKKFKFTLIFNEIENYW